MDASQFQQVAQQKQRNRPSKERSSQDENATILTADTRLHVDVAVDLVEQDVVRRVAKLDVGALK